MRKYKYIWLTGLLSAYALFMTLYFGLDLLKSGAVTQFWVTLGAEVVILIALFFFLRKREQLRREREDDVKKSEESRVKSQG